MESIDCEQWDVRQDTNGIDLYSNSYREWQNDCTHNGLLPKYGKLFRNIKGSQWWVDVDVHVDVVDDHVDVVDDADADADDVPSNWMVNQC